MHDHVVDVPGRRKCLTRTAELHLLRDCLTLGVLRTRVPARVRLERALGRELADRLLVSLTTVRR